MKKLNNQKISIPHLVSAGLVYISRFGMLPANMSPVGSFGFFGQNIFLYFFTIIAFDFFKGGFYSGFLFNYLGFFGYWLFGRMAKTQKLQVILLPFASFTFFIVSNFGVWWNWYPHNFSSLITCYTLAIPFYKNTLIGDLVFGYGYLVAKYFIKNFNIQKSNSKISANLPN